MADDDVEESQKTEEPTQRRIEEAVKKGQVVFSKEVTSFLILLAFTLNLIWFLPAAMKDSLRFLSRYIERVHDIDISTGGHFSMEALVHTGQILLVPIMIVILAVLLSTFMQSGFIFSVDPIMPKLEKLSIIKGFKRIFSLRSVVEFSKGILKITVVGIISVMAVWPYLKGIENLPNFEIIGILIFMGHLALRIMIGVCAVMGIVAALDYLYQRFEYLKSLRMTKRELKEEMKQSEGDPIVKGKLKQIRIERAKRRMMAQVPKADVVITNPTHYAVALKYESIKMSAPVLIAKGADLVALNIRKIAQENNVPVVEDAPLARALYNSVELDETIPLEHYQAVAEVIAYVYRLRGRKAA